MHNLSSFNESMSTMIVNQSASYTPKEKRCLWSRLLSWCMCRDRTSDDNRRRNATEMAQFLNTNVYEFSRGSGQETVRWVSESSFTLCPVIRDNREELKRNNIENTKFLKPHHAASDIVSTVTDSFSKWIPFRSFETGEISFSSTQLKRVAFPTREPMHSRKYSR